MQGCPTVQTILSQRLVIGSDLKRDQHIETPTGHNQHTYGLLSFFHAPKHFVQDKGINRSTRLVSVADRMMANPSWKRNSLSDTDDTYRIVPDHLCADPSEDGILNAI